MSDPAPVVRRSPFLPSARRGYGRRRSRHGRRRPLVSVALVAATALAVYGLFRGGGAAPAPPPGLQATARIDGTLVVVEDRRLVLEAFRELDGRRELEFSIRPEDARYFDMAHMRSHSAVGLPTRVYYERSGSRLYAVYKDDAPANRRGPG